MITWYPIFRDLYLVSLDLVERKKSPDAPSVMQTMLFKGMIDVNMHNESEPSPTYTVKREAYYWVEAKRIKANQYMFVEKRAIRMALSESLIAVRESRRGVTDKGNTIFSLRDTANLLLDWEDDESANSKTLIVRTAAWTPMHCGRWASPDEPPKDEEPIPERPEGDRIVRLSDYSKKAAA
jgi:hypothetical protein